MYNSKTLYLCSQSASLQVLDWDGRLAAVMGFLLNRQEASVDFANGLIRCDHPSGWLVMVIKLLTQETSR